jgi:Sec-independent protein translocase protein TatA
VVGIVGSVVCVANASVVAAFKRTWRGGEREQRTKKEKEKRSERPAKQQQQTTTTTTTTTNLELRQVLLSTIASSLK